MEGTFQVHFDPFGIRGSALPMRLSLHTKLFLSYTLLIAIIAGSVYIYLMRSLHEDLYTRTRQNLMKETRLIKTYLEANCPDTLTYASIDPIADKLGEQSSARVTIIGINGVVLGDSSIPFPDLPGIENHAERPEVVSALSTSLGESIRYSETLDMDMAYAAVPFTVAGKTRGVARLALAIEGFDWIEEEVQRIVIFAALIGLAFSVVLSYATARLVSMPIEKMTGVAGQLATGDFSVTVPVPAQTELHDLAGALNTMSAQLKRRITQIAEEKAQLMAVLSGMTEGVMVTDTSGRIILTNPAFLHMMRFDGEQQGKRPIEIVRNAELQEAVDRTIGVSDLEAESQALEFSLAGGERTFLVHLTPIRIDQESHGVVAVFHDITELRRLEQVRRDFVANVSHELRTPLTSIKGYAETLLDGAVDEPQTAKRFIHSIQTHTNRLHALVEDLLHLSRLESGRSTIQFRPCDLGVLAQGVVASLEDRISIRRLKVTFDLQLPRPARADEALMEQVLFNLIDNAIKYTPEEGAITIRGYEDASEVHLAISDSGVGIPADALPRIFERFYRVDRARSRDMGGTGLGLSIVKHAMELHSGHVNVESEVGRGATFTVTLPVWEEEAEG